MGRKKTQLDKFSLYLPAPGFKKRFMPPDRISVDAGDWTKQPLYLAAVEADIAEDLNFLDLLKKEGL